jgi:LCP family protein required for cell wall assembly
MARKGRRKGRWARILGGILIFFIALGTAGYAWLSKSPTIKTILAQSIPFTATDPRETFHGDQLTLLILGCDEDYQDNAALFGQKVRKSAARSDMVMVVRLDFVKKKITGLSLPRDLGVMIPYEGKMGRHKLNAAFAYGGADLSKQTVEDLLKIKVDRVIVINFDAFQQLVNRVNGVEVVVDKDLEYDDNAGNLHIHIKKGPNRLMGYDAMCFVRYRHAKVAGPGDDDFHRQQRQQVFLGGLKRAVLANWTDLPEVINIAVKIMGGGLNGEEVGSIAAFAKGVEKFDIGGLPVRETSGTMLRLDEEKLPAVLQQYNLADGIQPDRNQG